LHLLYTIGIHHDYIPLKNVHTRSSEEADNSLSLVDQYEHVPCDMRVSRHRANGAM
jgi:hypothetical protein